MNAVIWDVDGTLVDTAELHFAAWVRFAEQYGMPFTRADFNATFGRRNPEIIRELWEPAATDARCTELGDQKESLYRLATQQAGIDLLPGVRGLLEGFAATGWVQGVGSSAPRANLDLIFRLTTTLPLFAAIVAGEDVRRGKPDPEVFLTAAARLGVAPDQCVVFEDAVAGVEAAKAAGMACVAVTLVNHHPADKLRAAGADRVVGSLADLGVQDVARLLPQ